MATPWIRAVQETGKLTVFITDSFRSAPAWGDTLFTRTLDEFNRLAALNLLGVRLVPSSTPPAHDSPGANIQLEVTSGPCDFFDHNGDPQQETLLIVPGEMHGKTMKAGVPPIGKIGWAFVFVPLLPVLGKGQRPVGPGPKIAMLLHELLHAVGLDGNDPGHERPPPGQAPVDADLYMTDSVLMPGSTPELDKELVGGRVVPIGNQFFFSARTISLVQGVWALGQF